MCKPPTISALQQCGCSSVDRVLASEAKGRGFDPRQPHHYLKPKPRAASRPVGLWLSSTSLIQLLHGVACEDQNPRLICDRCGVYYFRLIVPLSWRQTGEKTEIRRSLRTKDAAIARLAVTVKNAAGTVLATLATYSNLNKAPSYQVRNVDLLAYKGQTVTLSLASTEDGSLQTSFVVNKVSLVTQ